MSSISLDQAHDLAEQALLKAGASAAMAASTARALVLAQAQGLSSHGLSRVPQYATHLRNGRANGKAQPEIIQQKNAVLLVDAHQGLAFPACELAVSQAMVAAKQIGRAHV